MIKKILFVLINLLLALNLACAKVDVSNVNANRAVTANANPANMPEGLSANQIAPTNEPIPGITDSKAINANNNSKAAATTPGIPDTRKTGTTPNTSKTPPIPGIPDEETLKKQMTTPVDRSVMDRKPPEMDSNSNARPNAKQRTNRNSKPNQ